MSAPALGRPGTGPVRRLLDLERPERPRVGLAAVLGALSLACGVALLATSAWLISAAALMPPILTLQLAIVGVRGFAIGRGVLRYAERLVGHDAGFRSLTRLRVVVVERLAAIGPAGLPAFRRGDLLRRIVDDVDTAVDLPVRVVIPMVSAALVAAASALLAFWLLPAAGIVLALALLVGGLAVPVLVTRAGRRAQLHRAPVAGRLGAEVVDILDGAADLLAFGAANSTLERARQTDEELTALAASNARSEGFAAAAGVLVTGVAVLASILAGVSALSRGDLGGTELAVIVLLPLAAYEAVTGMPAAVLALSRVRGSAARLAEIVDTAPISTASLPDTSPGSAGSLATIAQTAATGRGHLQLRDVSVRRSPDGPDIITGIDLDLAAGRRVAVIGPSGAGKTTLADALLAFLPYRGSITLDGDELRDIDDDDLRDRITASTQGTHVFDTTVAENLRLARREATDDQLRAVLTAVRLDDWLGGLPAGLDTFLGALGTGMSGGEQARLALARALLREAPVIVLDEPTEHLDPSTADAITSDLIGATRGRTTVVITHRLIGLAHLDEILWLEHGRVMERGTEAALLAIPGGRYASAHERQRPGWVDAAPLVAPPAPSGGLIGETPR